MGGNARPAGAPGAGHRPEGRHDDRWPHREEVMFTVYSLLFTVRPLGKKTKQTNLTADSPDS